MYENIAAFGLLNYNEKEEKEKEEEKVEVEEVEFFPPQLRFPKFKIDIAAVENGYIYTKVVDTKDVKVQEDNPLGVRLYNAIKGK
jgi:hypothetical protein